MKHGGWLIALSFAFSVMAGAQKLEFNGSYAHISGDGGIDGFNLGTAWWVSHRLSIAFDYDNGWDTSHLGVFELTQTGPIVSKNHLQDFLVGPRIYFGTLRSSSPWCKCAARQKYVARLLPFAEVQLGGSHISSTFEDNTAKVSQSASDNAFSWMLGGGGDYRFSPHWAARVKADFLRTHFVDTGQSRFRFAIGIMYSIGNGIASQQAAVDKRKAEQERAAEAEAQAAKEKAEKKAEQRKQDLAEQAERERLAAAGAAEAKRKADLDMAGAEARQKLAKEQLEAQQAAEGKPKPNAEAEQAATQARKETLELSEHEKQELRARLLDNFNRVLPTTDTPRGLVVNMGDVLFDTGSSGLRPEGRENLAKLSGIVINYPTLRLTIEGHTDNAGSTEFNQTLSEQRAKAVRDYLISQGLDTSSLSAQGLGENNPVADNSTAEGREKNRRVEIVLSGEKLIGTTILK